MNDWLRSARGGAALALVLIGTPFSAQAESTPFHRGRDGSMASAGSPSLTPTSEIDRSWPSARSNWAQLTGGPSAADHEGPPRSLKGIGLSLLLPGLAQYQMGHKLRATGYFTAEAAVWTAFASYRVQGSQREDSYVQIAEIFAAAGRTGGRSDEYYKRIGSWPSSDLFNLFVVRRDARTIHGDDLEARAAYYEANKIPEDEAWAWESEAARERYRDKRNDAQRSYKRSRYMIGLAVANRVVAMIDAVLLERKHGGFRIELTPDAEIQGARFSLRRELP